MKVVVVVVVVVVVAAAVVAAVVAATGGGGGVGSERRRSASRAALLPLVTRSVMAHACASGTQNKPPLSHSLTLLLLLLLSSLSPPLLVLSSLSPPLLVLALLELLPPTKAATRCDSSFKSPAVAARSSIAAASVGTP